MGAAASPGGAPQPADDRHDGGGEPDPGSGSWPPGGYGLHTRGPGLALLPVAEAVEEPADAAAEQVGIDAAVTKGVDHPAGPKFVHANKVEPVPEGALKVRAGYTRSWPQVRWRPPAAARLFEA